MDRDNIAQAQQDRRRAENLLRISKEAQKELHIALDKLGSARNWGIWDIFGGGFISGLMKHKNIDDAMRYVADAKENIRILSKELNEIHLTDEIENMIGGFDQFVDLFFDGLFADIYVQSKIDRLRNEISEVIRQLHQVDKALNQIIEYTTSRFT